MAYYYKVVDEPSNIVIHLTPVNSSSLARRLILKPGDSFPIGRASRSPTAKAHPERANAYFDCPVVSRQHAALDISKMQTTNATITDLGSMHGTFVNGQALVKHEPFELKDGDTIRLGDTVSRGSESYCGIRMTFKYDGNNSPDLAVGSRSFSVPLESEDDESYRYDSDYGSEAESLFDKVEKSLSSPMTSPISNVADGTSTKPIELEDQLPGSLRRIIDLDPPVHAPAVEASASPPCFNQATLEGPLLRVLLDEQKNESACLPDFEKAADADGPEILSSRAPPNGDILGSPFAWDRLLPETIPDAVRQPPSRHIQDIVDKFLNGPKLALEADKEWDQITRLTPSSSKMAIPNMLAPAFDHQRPAPPAVHVPEHPGILNDLPLQSTAKQDTAKPRSKPGHNKRKLDDMSTSWHDDYPQAFENLGLPQTEPIADSGYTVDDLCRDQTTTLSAKRKCRGLSKPRKSRSATFVRETTKYTLGAAMGAVSTFAFLASPLGGRFADWLGTL